MFQGLSQGATVSVLYRNTPKVADGRVVSVNTHIPTYNPQQPLAMMNGPVTDITIQIGDETIPFVGLPANGVVANFPDKGLFLAIDRSAIQREVDATKANLKQDLDQYPAKQKLYEGYESLSLELNPDRKKEIKQTEEMNAMRGELAELKKLLLETLGSKKE